MDNRYSNNASPHFSKSAVWEEGQNFYGGNEEPSSSLSNSSLWEESANFYGEGPSNSSYWVKEEYFYREDEVTPKAFLLIGFDTEFKPPDVAASRDDIAAGRAKNTVLSYQVFCKLVDHGSSPPIEWGQVIYPTMGERLSLSEILVRAISEGVRLFNWLRVPRQILIAGHFTRADIPAFSDFKNHLLLKLEGIRNTFVTLEEIDAPLPCEGGGSVTLKITIRDSMLLTPSSSKSLKALGEVVGVDKVELDPDPSIELHYKKNMDLLLKEKPALYERYALTDAIIVVRFIEKLLQLTDELFGKARIPVTLTSIGVDLLIKNWKESVDIDEINVLGKEEYKERIFSKRLNRFVSRKKIVNQNLVQLHLALAIEAYHGGRNEQFWFGPSFPDRWSDFDLSGAYPTAMALLKTPDWSRMFATYSLDDFTPTTLGVALVEFSFPESVRFPVLPVRTENGLVFPRRGQSHCGAPEIAVARALGASIRIIHGVVVPYADNTLIFGNFIKQCIGRRKSYKKGTLLELFWKEISNSSYGKTAQGLREKRVYSLRDRNTKQLPESRITNAYFAAFITSFVRATLGEIINAIPSNRTIFSCTTDGFLTNASDTEVEVASRGPIAKAFEHSRLYLTGKPEVCEAKHRVGRLLGWRTRGQATLMAGVGNEGDDFNYVLAKGGIYSPEWADTVRERNDIIVNMFLNRTPDDVVEVKTMTGVRDIAEFDADLVQKLNTKRLSMEYDWKRRPRSAVQACSPNHIAFSTEPWDSVDEFQAFRGYWDRFISENPTCLKDIATFDAFAAYVFNHSSLSPADARYLRKKDPDLKRLRQMLCSAWANSEAGLAPRMNGLSNAEFAAALTAAGVPGRRTDVENGRKKPFVPYRCPATNAVVGALEMLRQQFASLDPSMFVGSGGSPLDVRRVTGVLTHETERLLS